MKVSATVHSGGQSTIINEGNWEKKTGFDNIESK